MGSTGFIIAYVSFLLTIITLASYMGTSILSTQFPNIQPITCDIGGVDALVDILICFGKIIVNFFKLMSVSSGFLMLGIILTILSIAFAWALARLLRGGG